jgi:hypothetical protein
MIIAEIVDVFRIFSFTVLHDLGQKLIPRLIRGNLPSDIIAWRHEAHPVPTSIPVRSDRAVGALNLNFSFDTAFGLETFHPSHSGKITTLLLV